MSRWTRVKARADHWKRSHDVHSDRGDVPGWVLITLMTAGLVAVIWAVAGPALTVLFEQVIASVTGG